MGALQCFKVNIDETITEVKTEGALKEKLNTEECYIIVSDKYRKVYLWRGYKSTVRSKFIGSRKCVDICRQLGIDYNMMVIDEGGENSKFIKLIGGITEGAIESLIKKEEEEFKRRFDASNWPAIFKD